ncbi:MAG: hypothetical protein LBQ76_01530 [Candidatus Fibromonas sp.]|jgi:uncharacterized protein (TIGR02145 family)|nr:hypothetical protein [Candidatus Fibromonas sp.]
MNRIKFGQFILLAAIFMATVFTSCGEIGANFCGESRSEYRNSEEFCFEDEVYEKCEGKIYNALDSFCYKNVLYEKCGGKQVNLLDSFCYKNELYEKCDGKIFNPLDGFCYRGELRTHKRCPDNSYGVKYDSLKAFCDTTDGKVYDLCDNERYTPSVQFCNEDRIYPKCKNTVGKYDIYNPLEMGCFGGILYDNCDKTNSGPCSYENSLKCKNKKDKEIAEPYPGMKCDADGKIFGKITHNSITYNTVQIGEQVWMAENLSDYGNSKYNWAKAMNLRSECNINEYYTTTCTGSLGQDIPCEKPRYPECEQISAPSERRGLCPAGWRIPNTDEWQKLIDYAGGVSVAGNVLKAASGWGDINGTDNYGFNAKPLDAEGADWWTSEGPKNTATSYSISNAGSIRQNTREKEIYSLSVRCLQNN